jgi:hypothetical protein
VKIIYSRSDLNKYPPILAKDYIVRGKSSSNSIRPEQCPSIREASKKGILFFSDYNYSFKASGDYKIFIYNTINSEGGKSDNIIYPHILGSAEDEHPYFMLGYGLNIEIVDHGALILPPVDPRLVSKNTETSIAYLPPGYSGPLSAAVKCLGDVNIEEGSVLGQLIPLCEECIDLIEAKLAPKMKTRTSDLIITNKEAVISYAFEYIESYK